MNHEHGTGPRPVGRFARPGSPPRQAAVGPVQIDCPACTEKLGFALRITLERAREAAKRPQLPETLIICPSCRRVWIAGLHLSRAAYSEEGAVA